MDGDAGEFEYEKKKVITDESDELLTQQYYNTFCDKYDADMVATNFNGPSHVVNNFIKLNIDHRLLILDLLAGSGKVAELLKPHGYTNIEAIDGSEGMQFLAQEKKLYKNYYIALMGGKNKAPMPDEKYDIVISSGSFAPGHLYSDAFEDIIRMTKPGGIITWSVRSDYGLTSPRFANFDADVEKLVAAGIWNHYIPRQNVIQYFQGSDGYVYTMKKI